MKIAISTESTVDLPKELLGKYHISTIPYTIILGDKEFKDGEILPEKIFEFVDNTKILPKTSAINSEQYEEYFKTLLKDHDAVVHICLSGEITSACKNAEMVAEKLKNVYVVDSKSLSTGIALLAIYASTLVEKGESAESIYEKVKASVSSVQASFVLKKIGISL